MTGLCSVPCSLFLVIAAFSFHGAAAGGVIIEPGRAEVLVAPDASRTVLFAAADMTNHLASIFGKEVPVVTAPSRGKVQIVLGDNEWSRAAGIDVNGLGHRDAFRHRFFEPLVARRQMAFSQTNETR